MTWGVLASWSFLGLLYLSTIIVGQASPSFGCYVPFGHWVSVDTSVPFENCVDLLVRHPVVPLCFFLCRHCCRADTLAANGVSPIAYVLRTVERLSCSSIWLCFWLWHFSLRFSVGIKGFSKSVLQLPPKYSLCLSNFQSPVLCWFLSLVTKQFRIITCLHAPNFGEGGEMVF